MSKIGNSIFGEGKIASGGGLSADFNNFLDENNEDNKDKEDNFLDENENENNNNENKNNKTIKITLFDIIFFFIYIIIAYIGASVLMFFGGGIGYLIILFFLTFTFFYGKFFNTYTSIILVLILILNTLYILYTLGGFNNISFINTIYKHIYIINITLFTLSYFGFYELSSFKNIKDIVFESNSKFLLMPFTFISDLIKKIKNGKKEDIKEENKQIEDKDNNEETDNTIELGEKIDDIDYNTEIEINNDDGENNIHAEKISSYIEKGYEIFFSPNTFNLYLFGVEEIIPEGTFFNLYNENNGENKKEDFDDDDDNNNNNNNNNDDDDDDDWEDDDDDWEDDDD